MGGHCPLPEDLVVEVLSWLPVESLLRFKCVCKNWYTLIRSATFKKKHFDQKNNRSRLFVCDVKVAMAAHIFVKSVVFTLLPEKIVPGVTPEQKVILHLRRVSDLKCVAGPVDGLFLLQEKICGDGLRLGLWNPATREFRPLPPAPFEIEHFFFDHDHEFGLGFDLLTQDYKVVWIRVFFDNQGHGQGGIHVYACVYSSCDNSWKKLEFPSSFTSGLPYRTTYLNGVYYWSCRSLADIYKIQSFDMGSEQFGEMQGPDIPGEHWGKLISRGNSLAMLVSDKCMTSIYEMKQEGGCWSKVFSVQPRIDAAHWPNNIWENDMLLFSVQPRIDAAVFDMLLETPKLVLYDPTTSQVTDLGIQQGIYGCWVFNYKESLALIKRRNETQDQDEQIEQFFDIVPNDRKYLFTVRGPPSG